MCTYKVEQKVDLLGVHFKFRPMLRSQFPSFSIIAVFFFALWVWRSLKPEPNRASNCDRPRRRICWTCCRKTFVRKSSDAKRRTTCVFSCPWCPASDAPNVYASRLLQQPATSCLAKPWCRRARSLTFGSNMKQQKSNCSNFLFNWYRFCTKNDKQGQYGHDADCELILQMHENQQQIIRVPYRWYDRTRSRINNLVSLRNGLQVFPCSWHTSQGCFLLGLEAKNQ